jgi:fumarate reductase subunit D
MARRRPVEPILWLLFSAGGVASAMVLPALFVLLAVAVPLGWITPTPGRVIGLLGNPLVALVLLVVSVLSLFHWAQRFRYTLFDGLKLKARQRPINAVVYTLAVLGSVAAVVVLWQAVGARAG